MTIPINSFTPTNSPWMTRREAAEYLRWSLTTIDKNLIHMEAQPVEGKLRSIIQKGCKVKHRVRILAEDVYAIAPLPDQPDPDPSPSNSVIKFAA